MTTDSKDDYQAGLFSNRLLKRYRLLRKWARRERVTCYRIYDRDIPEIPLAADLYEFLPTDISDKLDAARFLLAQNARFSANDASAESEAASRQYLTLYLYERPYEKPEDEENVWLSKMADAAASIIRIPRNHVIIKTRRHDKGGSQYAKKDGAHGSPAVSGTVQEQGQLFLVNLTDYLDSGLFFDHRNLRKTIRETSSGKSVLNLYCYTGSFSVYAAEGKAARVESVDLSNTYLQKAKENMALNGFSNDEKYVFTRGDVTGFLNQKNAEVPHKNEKGTADGTNRFDIIILDPPTFSNSKMSDSMLDINRDWSSLVNSCVSLLKPFGILYFSTNSRRLTFNEEAVLKTTSEGCTVNIEDITAATIPDDYEGTKIHRCWKISAGRIKETF